MRVTAIRLSLASFLVSTIKLSAIAPKGARDRAAAALYGHMNSQVNPRDLFQSSLPPLKEITHIHYHGGEFSLALKLCLIALFQTFFLWKLDRAKL